jgi:uncharacterized protein (DUF1697 family)
MEELHAIVDADPFKDAVENPTRYFVVFLDRKPDTSALDDEDFAPDAFAAGKHELYVHCPEGMQNSRLMKVLSKPSKTGTATVRNWATVNKLLE